VRRILVLVGLAVVVIGGLRVITGPYSLHIGGSFTPLGTWSGVAKGVTPAGDPYAIQLNLSTPRVGRAGCFAHSCTEFDGTGAVCTKKAVYKFTGLDASGPLGAWWSLDGREMTVGLDDLQAPGSPQSTSVTLRGTWHGPVYQATDGGYLTDVFASDGSARTSTSSPNAADSASFAFRPGDFAALCRQVQGTS
jgi:hypothetical protein